MAARISRAAGALAVAAASGLWTLAPAAQAQTPRCDGLEAAEKAAVAELFARLKPYEGCADTFQKCLAAPQPSPLVVRHAAALGKDLAALEDSYARRRKSMTGTPPSLTFALDEGARLGEARAPVTVVLYVCTRCPFCREVVLALHREVTEDDLEGKVKVYLRPFPLKGHEGSTEGALALTAAGRQGKLWPYALYTFKNFDQFCPAVLADWAGFVGLDRELFEKAMGDETTRAAVTEVKKEGLRNKVEAPPTLFIDGRRYPGDLETGALVDALLEAYERAASAPAPGPAGAGAGKR